MSKRRVWRGGSAARSWHLLCNTDMSQAELRERSLICEAGPMSQTHLHEGSKPMEESGFNTGMATNRQKDAGSSMVRAVVWSVVCVDEKRSGRCNERHLSRVCLLKASSRKQTPLLNSSGRAAAGFLNGKQKRFNARLLLPINLMILFIIRLGDQ